MEVNIFQTHILVFSAGKTILAEDISTSEGCNRAEEGKKMAKMGKVYVQIEIKLRWFNLEDRIRKTYKTMKETKINRE